MFTIYFYIVTNRKIYKSDFTININKNVKKRNKDNSRRKIFW